ncbi:hypothetical protein GEMRC1_007249 [Eukaryota sp. GEM-RC1]
MHLGHLLFFICIVTFAYCSNVLFIYTGGTIGMKTVDGHYAPIPGYLGELIASYPQINDPLLNVSYTMLEYAPLLDSSNINSTHWIRIAQDIFDNYDKYDGFVVIHGTDTLAYTSSALSFLLQHLNKTVVVTGSQIPLVETYSDGWNNLIGSMIIAGKYHIPEVTVFFNNQLFRGNRVRKFSNWDLSAFVSGQYPILGEWGGSFRLSRHHILPYPTSPLKLSSGTFHSNVAIVYLFPSITKQYLETILEPHIKGLVILAFGMGNGPDEKKDFMETLKKASDRGVVLVDASQCFRGFVDLEHYATGSSMAKVGCVGAMDMTPEAAFTKLSWLLSLGLDTKAIKSLMVRSLRGELTEDPFELVEELVLH